jgi:hypothetical protein
MTNAEWNQTVIRTTYRLMFAGDVEALGNRLFSKKYNEDIGRYTNTCNNCAFRMISRYWNWQGT